MGREEGTCRGEDQASIDCEKHIHMQIYIRENMPGTDDIKIVVSFVCINIRVDLKANIVYLHKSPLSFHMVAKRTS